MCIRCQYYRERTKYTINIILERSYLYTPGETKKANGGLEMSSAESPPISPQVRALGGMLIEQVNRGEREVLRVLRDYPNINLSMIGIMVRPTIGPMYKIILQSLVKEGVVLNYAKERPNGTVYMVYCLANADVITWQDEDEDND